MRIADPEGGRPDTDLTARARIRDAAVACFAQDGFDASVRTIAQRAGVSPGLITHHFGSKAALRTECDTEVLRRYTQVKHDAMDSPTTSFTHILSAPGATADVTVYMLRAVQAGGQPARDFIEMLIDTAREVMAYSVQTGMVRPSRDEEARLRYLTYQTLGAMLVQFITSPGTTPEEFIASIQAGGRDQILPTLELFTDGLLTDSTLLDQYLAYTQEHEEGTTNER
ncbi:TetR family transcriptional regulator [Demequina capsici]|uniref:TetR family transcriptional regulator n=1 Tax=Demequina capsici TaxID=3075620 RepID=A0AA96FBW6_9MICO|nr:TetR family transcriptional regulator [Demequina sp. PMTSA13]WNM27444.1 TetR family transcriptional regulator [Demequina sp. PMTSA13]